MTTPESKNVKNVISDAVSRFPTKQAACFFAGVTIASLISSDINVDSFIMIQSGFEYLTSHFPYANPGQTASEYVSGALHYLSERASFVASSAKDIGLDVATSIADAARETRIALGNFSLRALISQGVNMGSSIVDAVNSDTGKAVIKTTGDVVAAVGAISATFEGFRSFGRAFRKVFGKPPAPETEESPANIVNNFHVNVAIAGEEIEALNREAVAAMMAMDSPIQTSVKQPDVSYEKTKKVGSEVQTAKNTLESKRLITLSDSKPPSADGLIWVSDNFRNQMRGQLRQEAKSASSESISKMIENASAKAFGKGIYNARAYLSSMEKRFPEGHKKHLDLLKMPTGRGSFSHSFSI